ncbi:MAG: hypothetical protein M3440_11790 [Chloroflexota bacterium]|nr:hypothetical protein [Chloroflexota bacterium]
MVRTYQTKNAEIEGLLKSLDVEHTSVAIEVDGEVLGVLLRPEEYDRYREYIREKGWAAVDELRRLNADKDPDEIYDLVTEIVEEVRQEHYDARINATKRSH